MSLPSFPYKIQQYGFQYLTNFKKEVIWFLPPKKISRFPITNMWINNNNFVVTCIHNERKEKKRKEKNSSPARVYKFACLFQAAIDCYLFYCFPPFSLLLSLFLSLPCYIVLWCYRFILITSTWEWAEMIAGPHVSMISIWFLLYPTHSQWGCLQ